jgi:hypothetical protein
MRKFSNFFLNAAIATRGFYPLYSLCIAAAFKARKVERKHSAVDQAEAAEERRRAEQTASIRASVQTRLDALIASAAYDKDPTDGVPFFERTLLNGSFKVTPALRATVRRGVRERRANGVKGRLLVVANKTNTIVSLGLVGDKGGVVLPKGDIEPVFLTDKASYGDWCKSRDFRHALARGWITLLPATVR